MDHMTQLSIPLVNFSRFFSNNPVWSFINRWQSHAHVEMGWDGKHAIPFSVMFGRVIEFQNNDKTD